MSTTPLPASYRDPSGFVFEKNGVLYRQINISFKDHFDHFIQNGCYEQLVKKDLLIPHDNIEENLTGSEEYYKTIRPERIQLVSYPYEWSFDMIKDAALLTLQLVRESLQFGMILKDATPYNIQWYKGKLIFIDTLSFEKYAGQPWIAYRQFCESFLGPLLIMHYSKQQLPQIMQAWPDGIPLATVRSLLPVRSRFSLYTYLHIHLHASLSARKKNTNKEIPTLSKQKLINLVASLEALVKKLKTPIQKTAWSEYYDEALQRSDYVEQKKKLVDDWIARTNNIKTAADLGANEGEFAKLLSAKKIYTLAADLDPYCINRLYTWVKDGGEKNLQPLVIDLANPTPAIGVNNNERDAFIGRINTDIVLALALIHHLAIGKNIPFQLIAKTLSQMGQQLIIEFVPKEDEKIQEMLRQKKDIYTRYTEHDFIKAFEQYFTVAGKQSVPGSARTLFLMKRNEG